MKHSTSIFIAAVVFLTSIFYFLRETEAWVIGYGITLIIYSLGEICCSIEQRFK